jgi:DNA repair exonuclease SbcCD ATPase subunit
MSRNTLNLLSVNPTGMFAYGLSDTIDLSNAGLVHLIGINEDQGGDSNGAGKSSLFNAICELLFQKNPTDQKGDSLINSLWGKGMAGRLTFTAKDGETYRITSCRSWKDQLYPIDNDTKTSYTGTTLFFDKYNASESIWIDCRGSGIEETKKNIQKVVDMDYQRFLSISYLSPKEGTKFLKGTNKDRMELLSGIVGLSEWDKILDECNKAKKALKNQVDELNNKISYEQGSISTLTEQKDNLISKDYPNQIKELNLVLDGLRIKRDAKKAEKDQAESIYQQTLKDRDASLDQNRINAYKQEEQKLKQELASIDMQRRPLAVREDANLTNQKISISNQIQQKKGIISSIQASDQDFLSYDFCPVCKHEISAEKKQQIITEKALKTEVEQVAIDSLTKELESLEESIRADLEVKKQQEQQRQDILHAQYQGILLSIQDLNVKINAEYTTYSSFAPELQRLTSHISTISQELSNIKSEGLNKVNQVKSMESKLAEIGNLDDQLKSKKSIIKNYKKNIKDVKSDLDEYLWLIKNIPSIKLHKMSTAMFEISNLINEYFETVGDTIRVNISGFTKKSNTKNASDLQSMLKDEVNIEIIDGLKNIAPKLYSDGELGKVSIALVKAMHDMAMKSGNGCNLMIMDEVFGYTDNTNAQKIAQSFSGVMNNGVVFLTDNSEKVKNLVKFDNVWHVRKSKGQAVLEVA